MASEMCGVCGEEADADQLDPHGHFDTDDIACSICGELVDDHFVVGEEKDHVYESTI